MQNRSELPEIIRDAFADQAFINLPQLSRLLKVDVKTLRKHLMAGNLSCRIKGTGLVHQHRIFSADDVAKFLDSLKSPTPLALENRLRPTRRRINIGSAIRAKQLNLQG